MIIQVDVDSTLYDADKLFAELANEAGVKWIRKAPSWFTAEDIGTDLKTLKGIFRKAHSREYVLQQKPYPNAVQVLREIAENYDQTEIAFVSDRNEQQTGALKEWLEQEGFLVSGDEYVAATKDKRDWMRETRPDIVIDDRVRTLLLARELGAYGVSLIHPHNQNLYCEVNGIYLVKDWKEMGTVLNETVIPKVETKILV